MCGHLCQSVDDPQISQIVGPLEVECGATMCGHLCQSVDDPWISQLGILWSYHHVSTSLPTMDDP